MLYIRNGSNARPSKMRFISAICLENDQCPTVIYSPTVLFIREKIHHTKLIRLSLATKIVMCYSIIVFIMGTIPYQLNIFSSLTTSDEIDFPPPKITRHMVQCTCIWIYKCMNDSTHQTQQS